MDKKDTFIPMNTSSVRNNFSQVIDTVLGKDRVMFKRYGKNKAALVTTDDADIISYLLDKEEYDDILDLAKQMTAEKEASQQEPDQQVVNSR